MAQSSGFGGALYEGLTIGQKRAVTAWLFLALPIVFYALVRFYPTAQAFWLSLTNWNLLTAPGFIGLANYQRMMVDPVFWQVMGNTLLYLALGLPLSLGLAFLIAYHLDRVRVGHAVIRALYFIPHITTAVAIAWVWRWFYQPVPVGLFNEVLTVVGLPQQPFLRSTTQALPAVLVPAIWSLLGFQIVIFLAGLRAIPQSYYEAAAIDGAGSWQILREITLPQLMPTLVFLCVLTTIGLLRIFDIVYAMTGGGRAAPGGPLNSTKPLVLYIYESAFSSFEMGFAAAQTVVLFLILLAITMIQLKVSKK
ncbi:MAG: sugar ABC transporter permease [Alphaproteobacteria bacterium]|nr:MAG: sugar ABC transporter permease [Alphaproteobacteria bacterium]